MHVLQSTCRASDALVHLVTQRFPLYSYPLPTKRKELAGRDFEAG
jgi:hypothetical protein